MNPTEAREGTLLLGGIDTAKFTPPLLAVPLINPEFYIIELTSLSLGGHDPHDPLKPYDMPSSLKAYLDSGSETMVNMAFNLKKAKIPTTDNEIQFLPPPLASAIHADAGARMVDGILYPIIDCAQSTNRTSLHFGFGGAGGPMIAVPKSELVIPRVDDKGARHCEYAVWTSTSNSTTAPYILGDTLLRSAYVVSGGALEFQEFLEKNLLKSCRWQLTCKSNIGLTLLNIGLQHGQLQYLSGAG